MFTTVSTAMVHDTCRAYDVFYGTSNQEVVRVDNKVYDAVCRKYKCSQLLTYEECKAAGMPVKRGERAVEVPAYKLKQAYYRDPTTGEDGYDTYQSPRTMKLFTR
jgi:hypothetical protein